MVPSSSDNQDDKTDVRLSGLDEASDEAIWAAKLFGSATVSVASQASEKLESFLSSRRCCFATTNCLGVACPIRDRLVSRLGSGRFLIFYVAGISYSLPRDSA